MRFLTLFTIAPLIGAGFGFLGGMLYWGAYAKELLQRLQGHSLYSIAFITGVPLGAFIAYGIAIVIALNWFSSSRKARSRFRKA